MASKFRREYGNQFSTDIEDIVRVSEARMVALMRMSLQDIILNASQPVAKGGRMRVDTGFLRASGQASLTGMPTGPTRGETKDKHAYDDGNSPPHPTVIATLGEGEGGLKLGATFFYGWTAAYAAIREVYDGFLEGALQQWPRIVTFNTDLIRERIKK